MSSHTNNCSPRDQQQQTHITTAQEHHMPPPTMPSYCMCKDILGILEQGHNTHGCLGLESVWSTRLVCPMPSQTYHDVPTEHHEFNAMQFQAICCAINSAITQNAHHQAETLIAQTQAAIGTMNAIIPPHDLFNMHYVLNQLTSKNIVTRQYTKCKHIQSVFGQMTSSRVSASSLATRLS